VTYAALFLQGGTCSNDEAETAVIFTLLNLLQKKDECKSKMATLTGGCIAKIFTPRGKYILFAHTLLQDG
jgi:hypothetical protein